MKKAILIVLSLVSFTAVGSVYQLQIVPYIVIAAVFIVTIMVILNKIQARYYPIYIFGLALSLLYQTSMLGTQIVGVDIHTEYFVANEVINNGWNVDWANNSNSSIVVAWFTPVLNWIGISPTWAFKVVYPIACALAPVVLFLGFRRIIGDKRAYLSCLFLIIMPMFTMEVVSIVKSMWAYLFLAFTVFFITSNYRTRTKAIGISLSVIMTILTHYAVGTILVYYMIGILGLLAITHWSKVRGLVGRYRLPLKYMASITIIVIASYYLWFTAVGSGSMIKVITAIGNNLIGVAQEVAAKEPVIVEGEELSDKTDTASGLLLSESSLDSYLEYTNPTSSGNYLHMQSPLVRTAIGLDFNDVGIWGKLFRIMQFGTQALLVIGLAFVILSRRYNFPAEYKAGLIVSFALLGACIFVPFFTTTLSPTRYYVVTLFFISPLLVIGAEELLRRFRNVQSR